MSDAVKIVSPDGSRTLTVTLDTAKKQVNEKGWTYAGGQTITTGEGPAAVRVESDRVGGSLVAPESSAQAQAREREELIQQEHGGLVDQGITAAKGAADAATFGGFSKVASLVDDDYTRKTRYQRAANPITDITSTAAGAILPGGAARLPGLAGRVARGLPAAKIDALGARVSSRLGGGVLGGTARGAVEGFGFGAAEEGRELTLSDNDLLTEQGLSAMATSGLLSAGLGGAITGGGSLVGKTLSKGFDRATRKIDDLKKSGGRVDDLGAEIANYEEETREAYLLAQGENSGKLWKSKKSIKNMLEKSDDIEGKAAARDALVAERKVFEDIAADPQKHLDELRDKDKIVIARMEQKAKAARNSIAQKEAEVLRHQKALDDLPLEAQKIEGKIEEAQKALAKAKAKGRTGRVTELEAKIKKHKSDLSGLDKVKRKKIEAKLEKAKAEMDGVRVDLGDDKSWANTKYNIDLGNELRDFRGGGRKRTSASLETVDEWIQGLKDDALGPRRQATVSRLPEMIQRNQALANAVMPQKTLLGEIAGNIKQTAQSGAAQMAIGAVAGGPIGVLAAAAARPVVNRIGQMLAGRLGKAAGEVAERTNTALSSLLSATGSMGRKSTPIASKVLSRARFAPEVKAPSKKGSIGGKAGSLVKSYRDREQEILSHVEAGPDGNPRMRMASRRQIAQRLSGLRAVDPIAADRVESHAARRIEYLARQLPKRPDVALGNWRPSDMQIRQFARSVAAVDDPAGVVERAAAGTITPEDAEALREVYPEQFADIQRQIIEKLPELRDKLPSKKRIALSILTGMPVDPALDPRILAQLQSSYRFEPGTEGGTHAPTPQPQFGSVKAPDPTPAQSRAANERI